MNPETVELIKTFFSGAVALLGAYLGYRSAKKQSDLDDAIREQKQLDRLSRIEEKIGELSKKVDIHNGYAEKFGTIAKSIALIQKDVEYLKKG